MRRFVLLLLLVALPYTVSAQISGPTTSSSGTFTLTWSQTNLQEVSSTGQFLYSYSGATATITKGAGTYYYEELWCGWQPYVGFACYVTDTHQVSVSSSSQYPESLREQSEYDYQIRSGDFDGNGRTDLYVERLTAGPADGSMQSYVVWNNSNGTLTADSLASAYAAAAQNSPVNSVLNLMSSDANADGYSDHFIERIDEVMGTGFEQDFAVFAPGTASNKLRPSGSTEVSDNFKSFFSDIARWVNDEQYFANNIYTTQIPIFALAYDCLNDPWSESSYGFYGGFCYPIPVVLGTVTVQYGVNFAAMSAAGHMDDATTGGQTPAEYDLWQISQDAYGVLGVHLFGFDSSGNRITTNFDADDDEEDRFSALAGWVRFAMQFDDGGYPAHEHDYTVDSPICSTANSWCTLANIACWGRHYHAPGKVEGYDQPAQNGDEATLDGALWSDDPIKVGVGTAAGLPENAVGNITLEGHIFHNPAMGGWGTCPQTVPSQGSGTPPAPCNQVYREPYIHPTNGTINMRTRGTGENNWDWANERFGPGLFEDLDEDMIEAILEDLDHLCPSL